MKRLERSGAGDPATWSSSSSSGTPEQRGPRRGPRPALSLERVVRSGDRDRGSRGARGGHDAAAREGARRTGRWRSTRSPRKSAGPDARRRLPRLAARPVARRRLARAAEAVARDNRALFDAHPWAAAISTGRPPLGPGLMAKYEHWPRRSSTPGSTTSTPTPRSRSCSTSCAAARSPPTTRARSIASKPV